MEERFYPFRVVLKRTQGVEYLGSEFCFIFEQDGIQPSGLGEIPDFFVRIQFGRVSRQIRKRQPRGVFLHKALYRLCPVARRSINDQEKFPSFKMLTQRFHKSNQSPGIEIAFCKLKHKMTPRADRRSYPHVNAPLSRYPSHGFQIGKRPSLAHVGNQYKASLVAVENQSLRSGGLALDLRQDASSPTTHLLGILFQRPAFGTLPDQPQPSQKSWHVGGMKPNPKLFLDQDAHP